MVHLPIEVIPKGEIVKERIKRALDTANKIQSEFYFVISQNRELLDAVEFEATSKIFTKKLFNKLEKARIESRGYHPFIFVFCDSFLIGTKLSNLFGSHEATKGLSIVTFYQVDKIIGSDDDSYTGYALYYLARYCMSFVSPTIENHAETRQCIFDLKVTKNEIIESIRSGSLCDRCRSEIWKSGKGTTDQMNAINKIIEHASSLIHKTIIERRPNIFIGSSTKHIKYARSFKELLKDKFQVQVWDEDQVFRLGTATIEQLEEHIKYYDFGLFLMMPDDNIIRGSQKYMVPRDNVIFEAGLFTGKLSRKRAIIISAHDDEVLLPSDLNGLTTIKIDINGTIPACLEEASNRISTHIQYIFGEGQQL